MYFRKIDRQLIDDLAIRSLYETLYTYKPGLTNGNDQTATDYKLGIEFLKGKFASSFEFGAEYSCVESGICFDYLRLRATAIESKLCGIMGESCSLKGALFSNTLMACAAGKLDALGIKYELEYLIITISDFVRHYSFKSFSNIDTKTSELTYGEQLYKKTGLTSIRGSAEEGFRTVLEKGIDFLFNNETDTNLLTRLYLLLISNIDDSKIIINHGMQVMSDIKRQSGQLSEKYNASEADKFDKYLRENQIKPKAAMNILSLCLFTQKLLSI